MSDRDRVEGEAGMAFRRFEEADLCDGGGMIEDADGTYVFYDEAAAEIEALRAKLAELTRVEALSREVVRRQKIEILSLQRRCTRQEAERIYAEEFWSGGKPKVDG